jgi:hypothetical protein
MVDDAVMYELLSTIKYPVKQGKNREFQLFIEIGRDYPSKSIAITDALRSNSLMNVTGNFFAEADKRKGRAGNRGERPWPWGQVRIVNLEENNPLRIDICPPLHAFWLIEASIPWGYQLGLPS